jgi:hypothetical protein
MCYVSVFSRSQRIYRFSLWEQVNSLLFNWWWCSEFWLLADS